MPASSFDWTETVIARLRQLWTEGHATAEIGRRLGVSKNAVVGKAHRLPLPGRPTPIRRCDPSQPLQPRRARTMPKLADLAQMQTPAIPPAAPLLAAPVAPRAVAIIGSPKLVLDVPPPRHGGRVTPCCWPIGEPGRRDFRFCEEPSVPGKPYCGDHSRTAYVRSRDSDTTPARSHGSSARRHA